MAEMNKANILAVADAIEKHSIPDLGFNMGEIVSNSRKDYSGQNCDTVACIIGWTYAVAKHAKRAGELGCSLEWDRRNTQKFLEISGEEGGRLCLPRGFATRSDRYPALKAVRVLRHLAEAGEVDWTIA